MEKFYIVKNKEFLNTVEKYKKDSHERNEFFKEFCGRNGIDGNEYYFGGDGSINQPFDDRGMKSITLHIEDTENNLAKFESDFKKGKRFDNLSEFKKSSKLLKAFQDECIVGKVVINLHYLRFGDYFKELHFGGYSVSRFEYGDDYYISIDSDRVDTITPESDGFIEIKGSQFYTVLERYEEQNNEK